ncbi:MAG TPA: hypothetical protein VFT72_02930 [Opitutaceae bacterium]|nr:hypothetical protein [Opitutaceae bacterium]
MTNATKRADQKDMNSSNAIGFLALGSLMNALPVVAPALVAGNIIVADLTGSALWLHTMGMFISILGGSKLIRDSVSTYRAASAARVAARQAVPVPQAAAPAPSGALQSA